MKNLLTGLKKLFAEREFWAVVAAVIVVGIAAPKLVEYLYLPQGVACKSVKVIDTNNNEYIVKTRSLAFVDEPITRMEYRVTDENGDRVPMDESWAGDSRSKLVIKDYDLRKTYVLQVFVSTSAAKDVTSDDCRVVLHRGGIPV